MPKKIFDSFFTGIVRNIKNNYQLGEPVPKLIDCALTRTVLRQAHFRVAFPKPKFWESLG
jgi:hypothetical protein